MAIHLGNESAARRQQSIERDLERDADRGAGGSSGEVETVRTNTARTDPAALSRLLPPSPRDPNAQRARWGRDPEGGRREMPPARVLLSPAPTTPTPAAPRRNVGERPAGYVGEPAVDATWLNQREGALKALRAEYEAARAAAQATPGSGPGWVNDVLSGNPNRDRPASDTRPRIESPDGRTLVFNEDAFAAHFRAQQSAQPSSALKALATSYGADAATLLATQPGLWALATKDHALNAGPPPPGRAMGDAAQLGKLDLYMADPQIAALMAAYGGSAAPAKGPVAQEQVRLYGEARFAQLSRLNNAMGAVRTQYSAALAQAEQRGSGVGWSEHTQTVTEPGGNENAYQTTTRQVTSRTFDPDAFTAWYLKQDGLANKAFAAFYGQSHTAWVTNDSAAESSQAGPPQAHITFDNTHWTMQGVGGAMRHTVLHPLNINDTPRLHDRNAVGFDLEAGWATHPSNIRESRDILETVVKVVIVGVVSYVSFNTLGPAAATAMGLTTTTAAGGVALTAGGLIVSSAVASAATAVASGIVNDNLTLKGILQSALAGGLSAGLMNTFGAAVQGAAGSAGTIALRTTVQGGIQALLGGKFSDGALTGLASGLADLTAANMESGIAGAVKGGKMSVAEAFAARSAARIIGSAIRALGNPNDPQYAFASSLVSSLMPAPPAAPTPGPTTEQVRELYGPDGSGTLVEAPTPALPLGGNNTVANGPPAPEPTPPSSQPSPPDGPGDPNTQVIVVNGTPTGAPWPRDDLGNRYELTDAGHVVVHHNDGRLERIEAEQAEAAGLSAELAAALRAPAGAVGNSLLTRGLALLGAAGPALAAAPLLSGDTPRVDVALGQDERYSGSPETGRGQLLTYNRQTERWDSEPAHAYNDPVTGRFTVISDEDLARQRAPTTTPNNGPLPPSGPPPLAPIAPVQPGTPGYEAQPPSGPNIETLPAEQMRLDDLIMESGGYERGTPEHKSAAWQHYQGRDGEWSYERWSTTYEQNQVRALQANAAVNEYHSTQGWGVREVTVFPVVNGVESPRRLDIADEAAQRGVEYKTGYQTASADNLWELQRDAALVRIGWNIEWVFRDRASQPLLDALDRAGIKYKIEP